MKAVSFKCDLDIQKSYENEDRWIVEGFATTSDLDFHEDVISQEAIEHSVKDLLENSTVLYNHKADTPIGKVEAAEAREQGLWIKIYVSKTVPEIWTKIQEGILNKFSIKGNIVDAKKQWLAELKRYVRIIDRMQLHEVSLVAVPANPKAKAISWYIEKALEQYEQNGGVLEESEEPSDQEGGEEMANEQIVIEEELITATGDAGGDQSGLTKGEASLINKWEEYYKKHDLEKKSKQEVWASWTAFCKEKGFPFQEKTDAKKVDEIKELLMGLAGEEKKEMSKAIVDQIGTLLADNEIEKAGRKVSSARLSKLKKLLAELMSIVSEVEPGVTEKSESNEQVDKLVKQVTEVESQITGLMKNLGVEISKEKSDEENPTLIETLQDLTKRLDAIESVPAVKTSIDGQEELPESKTKKTLWKGLI